MTSEASFASLCGVAPIEASSGKVVRHRLSRGNREANRALYMTCLARMRRDQRTKEYVARRTQEGKSKREIIRCLKRYVAREVYRVLIRTHYLRKQRRLTIGPSVSSRCERSARRIRDERPEHGIRDASLEAAHRLPARLALRQLLPMVRPAAGIAAGLADRDHVHDLVEPAVPGEREPVPDHLPA